MAGACPKRVDRQATERTLRAALGRFRAGVDLVNAANGSAGELVPRITIASDDEAMIQTYLANFGPRWVMWGCRLQAADFPLFSNAEDRPPAAVVAAAILFLAGLRNIGLGGKFRLWSIRPDGSLSLSPEGTLFGAPPKRGGVN